jgi:outer membrane protein assembly factor BamB
MKIRSTILVLLGLSGSIILSSCTGGGILATSWPGISLGQENVNLAYSGDVFSVRLSDGNLVWRYPEKTDTNRGFFAAPEIDGDQLLVGDYSKILTSLDANTGSTRWSYGPTDALWVASPLAVNDTIFAPGGGKTLHALAKNGKLLWEFSAKNAFWAKPVFMDDTLYVPSLDHFLYALRVSDGKKLWGTDLGGSAVASPALDEKEKMLYIGTLANELLAIKADSGKILWRFAAQGGIWNKPVINEGSIYFGDLSGTIYALDQKTGKKSWTMEAGGPVIASGALTPDGLVFASETGNVLMVSPDGNKTWTRSIKGKLYSAPVVASDRLVFGVMGGDVLLVAMDLKGNDLWSFVPSK